MNTEYCPHCQTEVGFPDGHWGVFPCSCCLSELFPCSICDSPYLVDECCSWEDITNSCEFFKHNEYRYERVGIGGRLADHQVIVQFVVDYTPNGEYPIIITKAWLAHNNMVRPIKLEGYKHDVALDGLSHVLDEFI